jgi:hypothetical protein
MQEERKRKRSLSMDNHFVSPIEKKRKAMYIITKETTNFVNDYEKQKQEYIRTKKFQEMILDEKENKTPTTTCTIENKNYEKVNKFLKSLHFESIQHQFRKYLVIE